MMGDRELSWKLNPTQDGLSLARDVVSQTLTTWDMPTLVDDIVIIVSELITNAVTHVPHGTITLTLRAAGRCLGGEVCDGGGVFKIPEQCLPDDEAESGRGLHIVAALSTRWGIDPLQGEPHGKTVWFTRCW
jgi:anti-sigma regulatory factor (Ser/Thr protein kinase)